MRRQRYAVTFFNYDDERSALGDEMSVVFRSHLRLSIGNGQEVSLCRSAWFHFWLTSVVGSA